MQGTTGFRFLPAGPKFQTCRYWIGGTRCQPSIGVRTRHSRGHALTSNMQMSATSDEVRTSCHYEEVYYKTKSYRCKPSPRGWPDTRYDGDSARTRTSLAGICGPSGLPRNLAVMMAGSRSQGDSYSKINSPADSGDDEGILSWGIISFPLPPTIPSYHGKAREKRSVTKKVFSLPAGDSTHRRRTG